MDLIQDAGLEWGSRPGLVLMAWNVGVDWDLLLNAIGLDYWILYCLPLLFMLLISRWGFWNSESKHYQRPF